MQKHCGGMPIQCGDMPIQCGAHTSIVRYRANTVRCAARLVLYKASTVRYAARLMLHKVSMTRCSARIVRCNSVGGVSLGPEATRW